jgi:hypothetical protein
LKCNDCPIDILSHCNSSSRCGFKWDYRRGVYACSKGERYFLCPDCEQFVNVRLLTYDGNDNEVCKSCNEGENEMGKEMVVKVLIRHVEPSVYCDLLGEGEEMHDHPERVIGFYRTPRNLRFKLCLDTHQALEVIRDAGGECIAGELLPQKCEDTWPVLKMSYDIDPSHPERCGKCLIGYKEAPRRCHWCLAKLSGECYWDENRYKQHGC